MMNILNGGAHASNNVDIQEFMIAPVGAHSFGDALRIGAEIYHTLGKLLKSRGLSTAVGDEGGYAPSLDGDEDAIRLICEAIETLTRTVGRNIAIAVGFRLDNHINGLADCTNLIRLDQHGICRQRLSLYSVPPFG